MPKETMKHRVPPRDAPAPTVGSRNNFESRGARRMAGKAPSKGPYTPPVALDNRDKVTRVTRAAAASPFS